MTRATILAVLIWLAAAGAAMAQGGVVPKEIILYVHKDLEAVLEYPYGLAGVARKPAELCEDDRATLVAAGVLKASPSGPCVTAMAR
jgi:hypothetical protein